MTYLSVKYLHISCVVISIGLFALRGSLELLGRPWRQWRVLRVAPHVIDTLLLTTALWMAWRIGPRTARETGIPHGLPYLAGFVMHAAIEADATD